jgi:hypothetical protein
MLRTGNVVFDALTRLQSSGGLLLRESFDLIFAHIAGSQLDEPDFQDYIIDTMEKLLDPSQTPDLKILEVVFLEKGASNALKQFVVDKMFAVERKMLGMMRGFVDDLEGTERSEGGCKYHVHIQGECYRIGLRDGSAIEPNGSYISQADFNCDSNSRHVQSSSTLPCVSAADNGKMSNLSNSRHFGSAQSSHEVHSLDRRTTTPEMYKHKPLPNIPPLVPGSLSTLPSPPHSPDFSSAVPNLPITATSTQQLIYECLRRLPPDIASPTMPVNQDQVPALVLECLERFKNRLSDSASYYPTADFQQNVSNTPRKQIHSQSLSSGTPGLQQRFDSQMSFEELPKPWLKCPKQIQSHEPTQHVESEYFLESIPQAPITTAYNVASIVKRKSAPPRGTDWLKQYDRVNGKVKNTFIMAKRSKESRFKELLSETGFQTEGHIG